MPSPPSPQRVGGIALAKDALRVAATTPLAALGRALAASGQARDRLRLRAGLPTRSDVDALRRAVADLPRAARSL